MAFPAGIQALANELRQRGFTIEAEAEHTWPRGGEIEMAGPQRSGIRRVRIVEDRGVWEVQVKIGRRWYDPHTSLLAIKGRPHQRQAMNHDEWARATLDLLDHFDGSRRQTRAIKTRDVSYPGGYGTEAHGHLGLAHAHRSAPAPAGAAAAALEPST